MRSPLNLSVAVLIETRRPSQLDVAASSCRSEKITAGVGIVSKVEFLAGSTNLETLEVIGF